MILVLAKMEPLALIKVISSTVFVPMAGTATLVQRVSALHVSTSKRFLIFYRLRKLRKASVQSLETISLLFRRFSGFVVTIK